VTSRADWSLVVAACALLLPLHQAAAQEPIHFGASLPLSGNATAWGEQARAALHLAEHDINAKGPINGSRVEIDTRDDGSEASQAVIVNRQLIEDGHAAVILGPHLSTQAQVTVPLGKRDHVLFVETAAAVPGLIAPARPWAVRIALVGQDANHGPFGLWLKKQGIKRIAVGYENSNPATKDAGSRQYIEGAKAAGVDVVNADSPLVWTVNMSDFSAVVTRLRSYKDIQAVALANSNEAPLMAKEMQRQGLHLPVWSGNIFGDDQSLIARGGDAVDGWVGVSQNWSGDPNPAVQDFVKRFKAELKQETGKDESPNTYAFNYYYGAVATAHILRATRLNGSSDLAELRTAVETGWNHLKNYKIMQGEITIGPDGEASRPLYILQVKDARWQIVATYPAAAQ
jgi:branched-chain amino acid transport system substrate-binding protein